MSNSVRIRDLDIGKIDASNELIDNSGENIERFKMSFLMPQSIKIKLLLDGEKYFVSGMKGTGKTALLRYIDLTMQKEYKAITTFVLFKSDISEEDKINFAQSVRVLLVKDFKKSLAEKQYIQDYETVWELFFHRLIVQQLSDVANGPFLDDKNNKTYIKHVKSTKDGSEKNGINRIVPKLTKGNLKLNIDVVEAGVEFEWEDKDKKTVSLSKVSEQLTKLLKFLKPGERKFYIFLDELELSLETGYKHDRDAILIRDLIETVKKFNKIFRTNELPIRILAGIRSEVLESVQGKGKEINKTLSDFGEQIYWHGKSTDNLSHPLIKIAIKKIRAAKNMLGLTDDSVDKDLFYNYFPRDINSISSPKYILDNTWYRPRDIVRILSTAASINPNEMKFSQAAFDESRREYSRLSWIELSEELSASLTPLAINAIKIIFTGFKPFFWMNDLKVRYHDQSILYGVDTGFKEFTINGSLLQQLFNVGMIGNGTKGNIAFSFRGNDQLFLDQVMMIHPALWPYFSIARDH